MESTYNKLREYLDNLATGYPVTSSGVEIDILKELFTIMDAKFFIKLSPIPEKREDILKRIGGKKSKIFEVLENMTEKGLLFRENRNGDIYYSSVPFVIGLMEFQLNRLTPNFTEKFSKYFIEGFGKTLQKSNTSPMRTIPVNRSLVSKWPIAPYEDVKQIFNTQTKIAVADCICRKLGETLGTGKGEPLEACFLFDSHAEYYVDKKMGRYVDSDEALRIIEKNLNESGFVLQPTNGKKVAGMCMCCGDHCGMLVSLKLQPNPAESVHSNYFVKVLEENCIGCKICIDRCQMGAIITIEEKALINMKRCIGCGTCIIKCPSDALMLIKKNEDAIYDPPSTLEDAFKKIMIERGKL